MAKRKGKGRKSKRVLIQPQPPFSSHSAWQSHFERDARSTVKKRPIVRLTEDGPDYGTQPRPGDEIGYGMQPYSFDDCFQAAIATATQVPIEQVPDLRIDERVKAGEHSGEVSDSSWERIANWAAARGRVLTLHGEGEVPLDRDRWIGVCPDPSDLDEVAKLSQALPESERAQRAAVNDTGLRDHCLVMSHDRLIFDPSVSVNAPPGYDLLWWSTSDISYGISFDKREE